MNLKLRRQYVVGGMDTFKVWCWGKKI